MWASPSSINIANQEMVGVVIVIYMALLAAGTLAAIVLLAACRRASIPWHSLSSMMKSRPWSWRDAGIILGCQAGLLLLAAAIASLLHLPDHGMLLLVETALFDGGGLLALYLYMKARRLSWITSFGNPHLGPGENLGTAAVFYLALMPVIFFSSLVSQGILALNGYPPSLQEVALLLTRDHPLWMRCYLVGLAIILAPVLEECLFRGLALPLLSRHIGTGPAILATSALFAAIHFHPPSFVPLGIMAAGFAMAYLYSGSLLVPIVMHALFNGINVLLLYLLTTGGIRQ